MTKEKMKLGRLSKSEVLGYFARLLKKGGAFEFDFFERKTGDCFHVNVSVSKELRTEKDGSIRSYKEIWNPGLERRDCTRCFLLSPT